LDKSPYPNKCNKEYKSVEPCPPESTNLSLLAQFGFFGLWFMCFAHNSYAIAADPSGNPGCPEFAFCTASAASTLMAFTDLVSIFPIFFLLIAMGAHKMFLPIIIGRNIFAHTVNFHSSVYHEQKDVHDLVTKSPLQASDFTNRYYTT